MGADHRYAADQPRHPIQVVARRTGLSADVIRAWERRHRAVSPERSRTSRRLYSDADVERLLLLRRATLLGRRIGDVAHLPSRELKSLVETDESATTHVPQTAQQVADHPLAQSHLATCLDALRSLDAARAEKGLEAAGLALTTPVLIEKVLAPMMRRVGDLWRDGSLSICHEHLATALVRSLLNTLRAAHSIPGAGPEIVVTTPVGQDHELGALMAAVTAASPGWKVSYLGPNLPGDEIASAAAVRKARAVALSLVYPTDDPRLADDLRRLRRLLAFETALIVGGPAAQAYDAALREAGALRVPHLGAFAAELARLR